MSFKPSISFRQDASGKFAAAPIEDPPGTLARATRVVLFIHGYNNSPTAASESFEAFRQMLGDIETTIVGVYWPGSNWSNFAFYMQSIENAKESAKLLAKELRAAAKSRPRLSVCIVAHSMGCRLTLEMLRELREKPEPDLAIEGVVLMAAAVPTFCLDPSGHLRGVMEDAQYLREPIDGKQRPRLRVLSRFSGNDWVLKYAFRIGQSLAPGPEGLLPVALGSREWHDAGWQLFSAIEQRDARGAGHGDYWGKVVKTRHIAQDAAAGAKAFLGLLHSPSRSLPVRETASHHFPEPRDASAGRSIAVRGLPHRHPPRRGNG